jgi:hypothetical protein
VSKKTNLKLYVWTGFSPDYTSGLAFAVARDEADARSLIEKHRGCGVMEWGKLEVHRLDWRVARCVSGGG